MLKEAKEIIGFVVIIFVANCISIEGPDPGPYKIRASENDNMLEDTDVANASCICLYLCKMKNLLRFTFLLSDLN